MENCNDLIVPKEMKYRLYTELANEPLTISYYILQEGIVLYWVGDVHNFRNTLGGMIHMKDVIHIEPII